MTQLGCMPFTLSGWSRVLTVMTSLEKQREISLSYFLECAMERGTQVGLKLYQTNAFFFKKGALL